MSNWAILALEKSLEIGTTIPMRANTRQLFPANLGVITSTKFFKVLTKHCHQLERSQNWGQASRLARHEVDRYGHLREHRSWEIPWRCGFSTAEVWIYEERGILYKHIGTQQDWVKLNGFTLSKSVLVFDIHFRKMMPKGLYIDTLCRMPWNHQSKYRTAWWLPDFKTRLDFCRC